MNQPDRQRVTPGEVIAGQLEKRFPQGFSIFFSFADELEELKEKGTIDDPLLEFRLRSFKKNGVKPFDDEEFYVNSWTDLTRFLSGEDQTKNHHLSISPDPFTLMSYLGGSGVILLLKGEVERPDGFTYTIRKDNLVHVHPVTQEKVDTGLQEIRVRAKAIREDHLKDTAKSDPPDAYIRTDLYKQDAAVPVIGGILDGEVRALLIEVGSQAA